MSLAKDAAYKALDLATMGRGIARNIGGATVRFPPKWSRYYDAEYEPETFHFFRDNIRTGDTVLDIGAHIGLFAIVTAKLVGTYGHVYAFEPTPFTRNVLKEVVELNDCSDIVEVRGEAVSEMRGETTFYDTGNAVSNANSLVKTARSKGEIRVPMISVDEFVDERKINVDCIKIDVEGAELNVLQGARQTFLNQRPAARLGLHPEFIKENGQSLAEIWQVLSEYGVSVVFNEALVDKDWFCSQNDLFDVSLLPSQ